VSEAQFQFIRSTGFVAAAAIALALQRVSPHTRAVGRRHTNFALWGLNLLVMGTVCGACACSVSRWASHHDVGLLNAIDVAPWLTVIVSVAALDLVSYGWHRANHAVTFLWRFHQVHHSDVDFTASTAVRFHPGELILSLPIRLAMVGLLGIPIVGVIVFEVVFAVANLVEHGNIDLRRGLETRVERLFVTPALHRRHHGKNYMLLGSNFGTIFSIWDRLLGTYGPSTSATRIDIGLPQIDGPVDTLRALQLPVHPTQVPSPR
jgi:sterol desaturase/sphingolipid hydroxylase (fatty acid hydroxylase superfamily)